MKRPDQSAHDRAGTSVLALRRIADTPPPADGSESAERGLRCLYPGRTLGQTAGFQPKIGTLSACFADLLAVRQAIAEHEKLEAQLKQTLQQAMGEASRARIRDRQCMSLEEEPKTA
jgi:hypothetical protein